MVNHGEVFERSLVSLAVAERPNYSNWRTQCIFAVTRESCKRRRPHGTESGADEAGAVWHEGFAAHSPPRHLHSEKSGAKKVSTAPHGVSRRNWQMTFVPVAEAATHAQCLLQIFAGIGAKSVPSCGIEGGVLSLCGRPRIAHPGDPSYPQVAARHVAGAGVHDLAAKTGAGWDTLRAARAAIKPHLELLAQSITWAKTQRMPGGIET